MEDPAFVKFLEKYGRYHEPRGHFYFRRLHERLAELGLIIISIERCSEYPGWEIRAKAKTDGFLNLLISHGCPKDFFEFKERPIERQLRFQMRQIIRDLGWPIKAKEIHVSSSGVYLRVNFCWPVGKAGYWRPDANRSDPFAVSLTIRRWLRTQSN